VVPAIGSTSRWVQWSGSVFSSLGALRQRHEWNRSVAADNTGVTAGAGGAVLETDAAAAAGSGVTSGASGARLLLKLESNALLQCLPVAHFVRCDEGDGVAFGS